MGPAVIQVALFYLFGILIWEQFHPTFHTILLTPLLSFCYNPSLYALLYFWCGHHGLVMSEWKEMQTEELGAVNITWAAELLFFLMESCLKIDLMILILCSSQFYCHSDIILPVSYVLVIEVYLLYSKVFFWSLSSNLCFLGGLLVYIHWSKHSFQFSRSVVSDSLWPHESQRTRPLCPSPTPGVYSNSSPSSWWCHPAISSSVVPFSFCPQSLPASGSSPMSQLFAWGDQSIAVSASASVPLMNTQDWSPLGWTGWISLQSKGLSRVFSNTTVQKHQFFGTQLSSQSNSHIHTWPLGKP